MEFSVCDNKRIMKGLVIVLLFLIMSSCKKSETEHISFMLQQWQDREILFPLNSVFTIQGMDTVNFPINRKWKVLTYVDSAGCTSCKLQLPL